jgi:hypothetical protein
MDSSTSVNSEVIRRAFKEAEGQRRIGNTRVGCALVVFLMPLGSLVDYFVYRSELGAFFQLRLICSFLAALIWAALFTDVSKRHIRWLSGVVPLLPAAFLAVIIARTDGFASSYYAAINLVLLAVGVVLHWTVAECVLAVLLTLVMYIGGAAPIPHHADELLFSQSYGYHRHRGNVLPIPGALSRVRRPIRIGSEEEGVGGIQPEA